MPFSWPTFDQAVYRLWRLRRSLVFFALLPVAAMLLTLMVVDEWAVIAPNMVLPVGSLAAALIALHLIVFPNASLETASLAIVIALSLLAAPLIKGLILVAPAVNQGGATVVVALLGAVVGLVLFIFMPVVIGTIMFLGPRRECTLAATIDVPTSVDDAWKHFVMQPNRRVGRTVTGEVAEDGLFDFTQKTALPDSIDDLKDMRTIRGRAMIVDQTPLSAQLIVLDQLDDEAAVTVSEVTFWERPGGCRVRVAERPDSFTYGLRFNAWLVDRMTDYVVERADRSIGRSPRALGETQCWSVGLLIAAALERAMNGMDPE